MRSSSLRLSAAGALFAMATTSVAADTPSTTRIETRPFYGATVTLEEGVRVFRPLPPHDRIIINPNGRTPLNLSYEERRSVSHNYHYGSGYVPDNAAAYAGVGALGSSKPIRKHVPQGSRGPGGSGYGHGGGQGGHR